jgi:hypothetical protein
VLGFTPTLGQSMGAAIFFSTQMSNSYFIIQSQLGIKNGILSIFWLNTMPE